jgi:hypothetical protein
MATGCQNVARVRFWILQHNSKTALKPVKIFIDFLTLQHKSSNNASSDAILQTISALDLRP